MKLRVSLSTVLKHRLLTAVKQSNNNVVVCVIQKSSALSPRSITLLLASVHFYLCLLTKSKHSCHDFLSTNICF